MFPSDFTFSFAYFAAGSRRAPQRAANAEIPLLFALLHDLRVAHKALIGRGIASGGIVIRGFLQPADLFISRAEKAQLILVPDEIDCGLFQNAGGLSLLVPGGITPPCGSGVFRSIPAMRSAIELTYMKWDVT